MISLVPIMCSVDLHPPKTIQHDLVDVTGNMGGTDVSDVV